MGSDNSSILTLPVHGIGPMFPIFYVKYCGCGNITFGVLQKKNIEREMHVFQRLATPVD